jgi:hypothetical protein
MNEVLNGGDLGRDDNLRFLFLPHPFVLADSIVSAALDAIGQHTDTPRRWIATSAGSSVHRLYDAQRGVLINAVTFAVSDLETALNITPGEMMQDQPADRIKTLLDSVIHAIQLKAQEYAGLINKLQAQGPPQTTSAVALEDLASAALPQRRAETQARDDAIKKMKDEHPDWSYSRLAREFTEETEEITEEQVRAAYRRNGWTWERADRVR